jgi:VanZ family protein
MALIWTLSSFSLGALAVPEVSFGDKAVHLLEFAGLASLLTHAATATWPTRSAWRLVAVVTLIATAWGVLDEIHQSFVPGRSADLLDIVADQLGAWLGVSLFLLWRRRRDGRSEPAATAAP